MKTVITLKQLMGLDRVIQPKPSLDQLVITKIDGRVRTQYRKHDCTHRYVDIINYNKSKLKNESDVICPLCDKFFSQQQSSK